jgi:hypothetical protein
MASVLRFEDGAGVLRLDLNSATGFQFARGFDLGTVDIEHTWLSASPHPGAISASARRPIAEMQLPLLLMPQANFAAMQALWTALAVELDRDTNIIKWQPDGAAAPWYIDTYRAAIPSLIRGQDAPPVWSLLLDPQEIPLVIPRKPILRGASSYL